MTTNCFIPLLTILILIIHYVLPNTNFILWSWALASKLSVCPISQHDSIFSMIYDASYYIIISNLCLECAVLYPTVTDVLGTFVFCNTLCCLGVSSTWTACYQTYQFSFQKTQLKFEPHVGRLRYCKVYGSYQRQLFTKKLHQEGRLMWCRQ